MPSGAATDALGVIRVLLLFAPVVLAVAVYGLIVGVGDRTATASQPEDMG